MAHVLHTHDWLPHWHGERHHPIFEKIVGVVANKRLWLAVLVGAAAIGMIALIVLLAPHTGPVGPTFRPWFNGYPSYP
jgi:hypothetical protein